MNFVPAIPEIFLLIVGCVALLSEFFSKKHSATISYVLIQFSLLIAAGLLFFYFPHAGTLTFNRLFILDKFAVLIKIVILVSTFIVFFYSQEYVKERIPHFQVEYYTLGLFAVIGMMVLTSAYNFITLFLGLELFTLPVYAMIALWRDSNICSEAAMKYFVIGSMASGIMLYGLSMIYGATRSLDIQTVAQAIHNMSSAPEAILSFGLVFALVGITFKLGAVPFHMWVPDVYEGAPSSVTLFIATAPKVAGLALAVRLLVDAMPGLEPQWQQILIIVSILSMGIGNFVAIVQSNIKRMLAYSSIAHIGYMLLGILTGTEDGYAAATFYMIAYALMSLVAFGMIILISKKGFEAEKIADFQGLSTRSPWLAFMMLFVMFSLAGIPPLVGFMAKFAVLESLIQVKLIWLAVLALLFAIIGSYYYLKVVKVMYFENPIEHKTITVAWDTKVVMTLNGLIILLLGFFPGFLLNICHAVFHSPMGLG